MRAARIVGLVVAMVTAAAGAAFFPPPTSNAAASVRLIIDYNDGAERHFTAVPWRKGLTVLDALAFARGHAHGIAFEHRGSGETAFVTRIDDLKNEGARGEGRNWTYRLNGKLSDRGCGVQQLEPSDEVRWKYSAREMK